MEAPATPDSAHSGRGKQNGPFCLPDFHRAVGRSTLRRNTRGRFGVIYADRHIQAPVTRDGQHILSLPAPPLAPPEPHQRTAPEPTRHLALPGLPARLGTARHASLEVALRSPPYQRRASRPPTPPRAPPDTPPTPSRDPPETHPRPTRDPPETHPRPTRDPPETHP